MMKKFRGGPVIAEYMKEILQCYHKNIVGT